VDGHGKGNLTTDGKNSHGFTAKDAKGAKGEIKLIF
jgi:hypothetical protein